MILKDSQARLNALIIKSVLLANQRRYRSVRHSRASRNRTKYIRELPFIGEIRISMERKIIFYLKNGPGIGGLPNSHVIWAWSFCCSKLLTKNKQHIY